jgi:DDE superfamily endonuclease
VTPCLDYLLPGQSDHLAGSPVRDGEEVLRLSTIEDAATLHPMISARRARHPLDPTGQRRAVHQQLRRPAPSPRAVPRSPELVPAAMVRQTHEKGAAVAESAAARRLATAGGRSSTRRVRPGTSSGTGGSWTRPKSRSPAAGSTCIGRSISTVKLSTYSSGPARDAAAARSFFARALRVGCVPAEVTTDRAPVYPRVLDELQPAPRQVTERYANNGVEADHGRLKARLRRNVRTQTIGLGAYDRSRARVRAEPPARPLRDHQRPRLA